MQKCPWALKSDFLEHYHDHEWGVPLHNEKRLFELLILEGQQAGLSWDIIIKKRRGMREAFGDFDPCFLCTLTEEDIDNYMFDNRVIKNRTKITSIINNAKNYFVLVKKYGSLNNFFWSFVAYKPIVNNYEISEQIPSKTPLSLAISKELKKLGFSFVGPTTIYSFMQACGMVNDHLISCPYHKQKKL